MNLPFYTPIGAQQPADPVQAPQPKPLLSYTPGVRPQGPEFGAGPVTPQPLQFTPIDAGKVFSKPEAPGPASAVGPALGGLNAASAQGTSYDKKTAVINTLITGLSGAASGALAGAAIGAAGGPIGATAGAAIGGTVGIVSGAFKAYTDLESENKRKRERKRVLEQAKKDQEKRDAIARRDAIRGLKYDRKQANLRNQWAMSQTMQASLAETLNANDELRANFVKSGFISQGA